jgi:hypothetical protein
VAQAQHLAFVLVETAEEPGDLGNDGSHGELEGGFGVGVGDEVAEVGRVVIVA